MAAGSGSSAASPCAACKLLRRRCSNECMFAPYFPADEPHKFASVHKVFGASNVCKMLQELGEEQRGDAVSALVYEAYARVRDPVYGCAGAISSLQQQVDMLQSQLAVAQAQVAQLRLAVASPKSSIATKSYGSGNHTASLAMDDQAEEEGNNHSNSDNYSLWSY